MTHEAVVPPDVRAYLDTLAPYDRDGIWDCIHQLEQNPNPPAHMLSILVVAGILYVSAYWCGQWGIAFHVEDDHFVVIDAVGRFRP